MVVHFPKMEGESQKSEIPVDPVLHQFVQMSQGTLSRMKVSGPDHVIVIPLMPDVLNTPESGVERSSANEKSQCITDQSVQLVFYRIVEELSEKMSTLTKIIQEQHEVIESLKKTVGQHSGAIDAVQKTFKQRKKWETRKLGSVHSHWSRESNSKLTELEPHPEFGIKPMDGRAIQSSKSQSTSLPVVHEFCDSPIIASSGCSRDLSVQRQTVPKRDPVSSEVTKINLVNAVPWRSIPDRKIPWQFVSKSTPQSKKIYDSKNASFSPTHL